LDEKLDEKQNTLGRGSSLNINGLIVSNSFDAIILHTPGLIRCDSLLVGGVLKQDLITNLTDLTARSLTVYTEKLKSSETLDRLIYRLIEQ
jgi:hypothetical protein